jgi:hypothetical protein
MESYNPPTDDFLKIIVGLHDKLTEDTFTKLFVRVCAKYNF